MREVAARWNEAHAMLDAAAGRRCRAEWDKLQMVWGSKADARLREQVAPPADWLREQDELDEREHRHAAALATLERALGRKMPAEKLHRLHEAACLEGEIPLALRNTTGRSSPRWPAPPASACWRRWPV